MARVCVVLALTAAASTGSGVPEYDEAYQAQGRLVRQELQAHVSARHTKLHGLSDKVVHMITSKAIESTGAGKAPSPTPSPTPSPMPSPMPSHTLSPKPPSTGAGKTQHHGWGYGKENGPSAWTKSYHGCAGKEQSPIDIQTKSAVGGAKRGQLKIRFLAAHQGSLKAENNGHTIRVSGFGLNGDSTELAGHEYKLQEFHFHAGSETRVDGKQFPLEAQFVHKNAAGKYLVVAVLFNKGKDNAELSKLGFGSLAAKTKGRKPVAEAIEPMGLLPGDWKSFYFYKGSFTTPPCALPCFVFTISSAHACGSSAVCLHCLRCLRCLHCLAASDA